MQERNEQDVVFVMAQDLTYNRQGVIDFLRKNGAYLTDNPNNDEVARALYDFIKSSQLNREKYASWLVSGEYRYIDPITITIIATTLVSIATGTAGAIRQGKVGRQAASRYERGQQSLEDATYAQERESRRAFLTNLFTAQQKIILEDEKSYRQAQTLKRVSLGFMVLTLILGGIWLATKKA
jgi:hypothetical protein